MDSACPKASFGGLGALFEGPWVRNVRFLHFWPENHGKARRRRGRISERENVDIPGPVRPDNGQKWTQRAETYLLVQYERHLRVLGQVSAPAEGGAPMYRRY